MKNQSKTTTLVVSETFEFSVEDISAQSGLPVEIIVELIELGLFETSTASKGFRFDEQHLSRVQSASRLFHDLKLNAPGVVLALELLDEIESLRQKIAILQRLTRI